MGELYDVAGTLKRLLSYGGSEEIWDECWNHIVYQDDIGEVSYAAVPYLAEFIRNSTEIDWNAVALISAIELARPNGPTIPEEVRHDYENTIQTMPVLLAHHPQKQWDELTTRCAASCIALSKGQRELAQIYAEMSLADGVAWLKQQSE